MTVVIIDDICSLKCPYCFYSTKLAQVREKLLKEWKIAPEKVFIKKETIKKIIQKLEDFNKIKTTKIWPKTIAISGWEPTLHPDFIDICKQFLKKWYNIHLLSNFSFPNDWKVAKFLKKNINRFEFLVNVNEEKYIWKQLFENTINNVISLDTDKMKISLNIFHTNFDFSSIYKIFYRTRKTYIIRFWFPNPEINNWINKTVVSFIKNKQIYYKQLLEDDINYIKKYNSFLPYWWTEPSLVDYYKLLWKELNKLIKIIKDNWWTDRVKFYIDCWFPYDIIPEKALWFILQRIYYKNLCSIPNGDTYLDWTTSMCYTLWQWWNTKHPNIQKNSFNTISKYYILPSRFLQDGFLNLKDQACVAYAVRFFYQLFWDMKNKDEDILSVKLKPWQEIINKYLNLYKNWKHIAIIRMYQLIEFFLSKFEFETAKKVINYISNKVNFFQLDEQQNNFRYHYYRLITDFLIELEKTKDQEKLRKTYLEKLEQTRKLFNINNVYPKSHIKKLDAIVEQIICYQQL